MATLLDLAAQMRALSLEVPEAADALKRGVAIAMLDSVLQNTPVDTSRLVSNWRVSTGAIQAPTAAYVLGKGGSTRQASIAAARAAGVAAINAIPAGQPIVIYNSVDYARFLNDGTSEISARLFVEIALRVGAQLIQTAGLALGVKRG